MLDQILRHWWVLTVRGVAAIIFGILALARPGITLQVLVIFFGAYALVDGICSLIAVFQTAAGSERWWGLLLEGIAGILVGILAFMWPAPTILALVYLIAAWAIMTGILEIVAAIRLRKDIQGEWLLGLSGALSVLWGIVLAAWPASGALVLSWLIGGYAIVAGIVMIGLSLRLRDLGRRRGDAAPA